MEVERQRKASVSSSGLSDPSPLNIDSDRSPAAFSSEGERSPATRSPLTPGFVAGKQFSPVTEKSPSVPAYSPRYETALGKSYASGYDDKSKYQANGTLKVGFYQDMADKGCHDKGEQSKNMEQKLKESPIYSPTVPYVSPLYSNKDQNLGKQKSPGRYNNYYSSVDSSLDKPKTPGYYSSSAPSTPTDRPSPATPSEDKQKSQYGYYNYDPTRSLTDQYKNTGSSSKTYYNNESCAKNSARSPINASSSMPVGPSQTAALSAKCSQPISEKPDMQPPKKRQALERALSHQQSNPSESQSWEEKAENRERSHNTPYPAPHPLPADLANLSQIVSRIPEPQSNSAFTDKERLESLQQPQSVISGKTVHPTGLYNLPPTNNSSILPQGNQMLSSNRSIPDISRNVDSSEMQSGSEYSTSTMGSSIARSLTGKTNHLQSPPAAHQKPPENERPGSRNMPPPHSSDKPHGYFHQKTMWSSSLPSSSLSSLVSNATMASIALAGQKGVGSFPPPEHLAQFGMDRAALASLRQSQGSSQLFPHDILQRDSSSQSQENSSSGNSSSSSLQSSHSNKSSSQQNPQSRGTSSTNEVNSSNQQGTSSSGTNSSNSDFDLTLNRPYSSMMNSSQSSSLFPRNDNPLTTGSLGRPLSGTSSPFLSQSPGLGGALPPRTPTPAHQSPSGFPSISRDPRDPISQSHPSLQIPSLNSIAGSQAQQTLNHLNSLAYPPSRETLSLINQGGRGPLVDPSQQLYQQYIQRSQLAAQEELFLRSAGAHSQLAAHQSMMLQQGLMSAAAASYPSGYPHSLGLRSGSYQGMNRPWI